MLPRQTRRADRRSPPRQVVNVEAWHDGEMDSRMVVLGSCGAWPEPGRACSGFLLEHDGFRVALDLGYGTLPRLLSLLGSTTAIGLDAIIVTHDHPDHVVDLHGLFRARLYDGRQEPRIALYSPEAVLERIAGLEDSDRSTAELVFTWLPIPAGAHEVGPFRLESWALPHYVPNAGVRLSTPTLTVAYTGDTGPDPTLAEVGRDADLYIVDATDRWQQPGIPPGAPGPPMNLTAREAGEVAAAAGADRLMLTHFWPGNDRDRARAAAAAVFSGDVLIADEGAVVDLC
jgi:ribonuclease BN (tRNA processing enzyme)